MIERIRNHDYRSRAWEWLYDEFSRKRRPIPRQRFADELTQLDVNNPAFLVRLLLRLDRVEEAVATIKNTTVESRRKRILEDSFKRAIGQDDLELAGTLLDLCESDRNKLLFDHVKKLYSQSRFEFVWQSFDRNHFHPKLYRRLLEDRVREGDLKRAAQVIECYPDTDTGRRYLSEVCSWIMRLGDARIEPRIVASVNMEAQALILDEIETAKAELHEKQRVFALGAPVRDARRKIRQIKSRMFPRRSLWQKLFGSS